MDRFFAVAIGLEEGIFLSWDVYQMAIKHFLDRTRPMPGARHKICQTFSEAVDFMNRNGYGNEEIHVIEGMHKYVSVSQFCGDNQIDIPVEISYPMPTRHHLGGWVFVETDRDEESVTLIQLEPWGILHGRTHTSMTLNSDKEWLSFWGALQIIEGSLETGNSDVNYSVNSKWRLTIRGGKAHLTSPSDASIILTGHQVSHLLALDHHLRNWT